MKKLWIAIAAILIIGFAVIFLKDRGGAKSGEIKVGHIAPFTGDAAVYGEWEKEGIALAIEEINQSGGIDGKRISVIDEDDQADPSKGISSINKLIFTDKVQAIIGAAASSVTLAIAPVAEKNKVVLISAVSAADKISEAGDYIFRVFPTNKQEASKLASVAKALNYNKASILFINNDFGSELSRDVTNEFTKDGGTIIFSEGYDQNSTDFRTLLSKVKSQSSDTIFLLGYPKDMALICKQAKELGLNTQLLAPDTFYTPEIIGWSGGAAEGVIFVTPGKGIQDRWNQFSEKIKAKYGKDANIASAMAYDAVYLLAEAMGKVGLTGTEIKSGLYKIKDYPGVTGNITFDEKGDVKERLINVYKVENGSFVIEKY